MKSILFFFLLITITTAKASNYYFSSVSGDDMRTPVQARNPATPWKTVDKLNSFFNSLKPGDSVLLRRGDTFYGSVTLTKSGTSGLPIVIGAYGAGNKPVITGLVPLSFVSSGNNIYESQALTSSIVNVLIINGSLTAMGRYPNNGYLNFESHSGTSSITDNDLGGSPNWTGAELVLRIRRWVLDRDVITSHSGNTISYTASSKYEPKDRYGYFIQNSPLTLDKQGEWYFNPSTKKILLYSTSQPANVSVAVLNNLIISSGISNVTVTNINLQGSNKDAISINSGSNISIQYCDILFSGEDGVKANNHTGFKMEYSSVVNSLNNGIDLGSNCGYAVLTNNLIQNTSVLAGMGPSGDKKGLAIFSTSSNNLIAYNRVMNSGYIAIYFAGDATVVQNNFVDSFCTVKDDGGGVYTYIGKGAPRVGRKVTGNIIINGLGAPAGADNTKNMEASGIYMDDNSSGVEISNNSIANCGDNGINIHNSFDITISNNTLYNNKKQLNLVQDPDKNAIRNCTVTQNIMFSKLPSQQVSSFKTSANDADQFGKFDGNYYAKPVNNKIAIFNNHTSSSGNGSELEGWKASYGKDDNSKAVAAAAAVQFNPGYTVRFEYNPSTVNKTVMLDGNYADPKNNKFTGKIILPPYTSAILIKQ